VDQWANTLRDYADPVFGDWPVGDVDTDAVMQVLMPIWNTKTETASRAPLSNVSMAHVLKRMGQGQYTVHGMRSTFRDGCAEQSSFPREIAEAALAHVLRYRPNLCRTTRQQGAARMEARVPRLPCGGVASHPPGVSPFSAPAARSTPDPHSWDC
jgi:hypothetical protein